MFKPQQRKYSILIIIFTLQLALPLKSSEFSSINRVLISQDNERKLWFSILRQIDTETYFDYALIIGEIQHEFLLNLLEMELEKSVLLNGNYTMNYNLDIFSSSFITIVFMPRTLLKAEENIKIFVKDMGEKLDLRRLTRLIFVEPQIESKESDENIEILLRMCKLYKFLNVIVMLKDFSTSLKYYSYKTFPYFEQMSNVYNDSLSVKVFPNKMDNMYGAVLRTIPDQIMPRSVVYKNELGQLSVTGYISKFIHLYGKYVNSTIKYPNDLVAGDVLFYRHFINWTQMNLLDIPCSITPMVADNTTKLMSYMYEMLSWCLMMPIEQPLTYQHFLRDYLNIYIILVIFIMNAILTILLINSLRLLRLRRKQKFSLNLADILSNSQVILGHLGSSFTLHAQPTLSLRIIYMVLFLSGLLYTTTFSVQLNAFLTYPSVHQISSLDEMLKYKRKVLTYKNEYKIFIKLSGSTFLPYLTLFRTVESYKEFYEIRGSYNTSYSYPITSSVWYIYETQQKLFSKPLFRWSNICFVNLEIMGFILPPNSLHKQKLDTLIIRARDMGLLTHWLQNNFYDLVKIGKMNLTDISVNSDNNTYIHTKDIYFVLLTMLKAFSISLTVFFLENLWYYRICMLSLLYSYFKPEKINK